MLSMVFLAWAVVAQAEPRPGGPRLAVLELASGTGVDASVAAAFTASIVEEIATKKYFEVISAKEVQTLLGLERQRQMAGCSEQDSCVSEIAGALGARFVLSGALTKLGEAYQLSIQTLDSKHGRPLGRSTKIARTLEALRTLIPFAVADATGTPPPPSPSHLLSYGLLAGAGLAGLGGALVGLQALSTEAATTKELQLGTGVPGVLKPVGYYQDIAGRVQTQKDLSLIVLGAGALMLGAGVYLEMGPHVSDAPRVSLVLTGSGATLIGEWP